MTQMRSLMRLSITQSTSGSAGRKMLAAGTFSRRFTELTGTPPCTYRRDAARATAGMPSCVARQVTRPIRNREAPVTEPHLA
jgi:hypothetical protein